MSNNMNDTRDVFHIEYRFVFKPGLGKKIDLRLDKRTLDLVSTGKASHRKWTKLSFLKCQNCPLDETQHANCPTAMHLVGVVDFFRDMISFEKVDLFIRSEEREYVKHTTLQQGISSLVGICMVASGCPIMGKLKPMVRYHLPFATLKETQYRVISMYLLAQYFLYKRDMKPDWDLKNLVKMYGDIQIVNKGLFRRLAHIKIGDATLNALIKLDIFAKHVSDCISQDVLDEMEHLFAAYFVREDNA
jgi:hypothetical protein